MSLPHILLGLLNYQPMTGYELKHVFDQSIHYFWNATLPQIYRMLNQMEAQGYLTVTVEHQDGKPSRKVYTVTRAGEEELKRWLGEEPGAPDTRSPLLARVFFGRHADPETLAEHIRKWGEHYTNLLRQYEEEIPPVIQRYATLTGATGDARYWALTLDFGRRYARLVIEWCEAALAVVGEGEV